MSSGWDFLWYHNGNEIQAPNSVYTIVSIDHPDSGEYKCKAKRGKGPFYTEESKTTTLQVSGKLNELCMLSHTAFTSCILAFMDMRSYFHLSNWKFRSCHFK